MGQTTRETEGAGWAGSRRQRRSSRHGGHTPCRVPLACGAGALDDTGMREDEEEGVWGDGDVHCWGFFILSIMGLVARQRFAAGPSVHREAPAAGLAAVLALKVPEESQGSCPAHAGCGRGVLTGSLACVDHTAGGGRGGGWGGAAQGPAGERDRTT